MTSVNSLPDFGRPISRDAVLVYPSFDGQEFTVMPGNGSAARSDLALDLIRRADQPGEGNYALLDVSVTQEFRLDDGLWLARALDPAATVKGADIDIGFARLVAGGPTIVLPMEMTSPSSLGWTASGARWTQKLDLQTGELIRGALLNGEALFRIRLEYTVRGVSPRANAKAEFIPAELMSGMLASSADRGLSWETLRARLTAPAPGLHVTGDAPTDRVAEALADRLLEKFAVFAPAKDAFESPCFSVNPSVSAEKVVWDLDEPILISRAFLAFIDPLTDLRNIPDRSKLIREITIPPLDLGFRELLIAANLPKNRAGVAAIGSRIVMAPAPPERPSGINANLTFNPPEDTERLALRIGVDEQLTYDLVCFAVIVADGFADQFESPPCASKAMWMNLPPQVFPVSFAHIVATDRLLRQASISGNLTYVWDGIPVSQSILLRSGAEDVAVAAPIGASKIALNFVATSPDGETVSIAPPFSSVVRLDLSSFPGYGPHRIPIKCLFKADSDPIVIDLSDEAGVSQATLALAPTSPTIEWGYVAATPFRAGFRYRKSGGTWSSILPPAQRLTLTPDGAMITDDASGDGSPPPYFTIDNLQIFVHQDYLGYILDTARAEMNSSGKPTLSIFRTPQATRLQLGAHFALSADEEAALKKKIIGQYPQTAAIRLQPEAIGVDKASLVLAEDNGSELELASSSTSGFPPFSAVFSADLTGDRSARVMSAVGGRRGILFVDYLIRAQAPVGQVVRRADVANWFAGTEGLSHIIVLG